MITKNIKEIIKNYFLRNPTKKIRVRQLERETNTALPSVIRYTKELLKENIIKKEMISEIKLYSANRASKNYLHEKKLFNQDQLFRSGLIEFLIKEFHSPTIIVFGSFAKGEDIEKSDIDIFIESSSKKKISLEKFEKSLERGIQLFVHKSICTITNDELKNSIINGIVLNGFLEVL